MTETAAKKVETLRLEEGKPEWGLRLRVVGGGCSGFSYELGWEDAAQEGDQRFRAIRNESLRPLFEGLASKVEESQRLGRVDQAMTPLAAASALAAMMERMAAILSHILACSGNSSQMLQPGTLVEIGLNSPANSFGASGFRSYMSMCDGPPGR